jgi:hypothetical protein
MYASKANLQTNADAKLKQNIVACGKSQRIIAFIQGKTKLRIFAQIYWE